MTLWTALLVGFKTTPVVTVTVAMTLPAIAIAQVLPKVMVLEAMLQMALTQVGEGADPTTRKRLRPWQLPSSRACEVPLSTSAATKNATGAALDEF